MTLQTSLIIAAVIALFAFGGGWKLRDYQAKAEELAAAKASLSAVQKALIDRDALTATEAMKSRTLEETLAAMRQTQQDAQITRENEYAQKTIYAACVLPDDGVRLLNARIAARHPAADPGKR